MTILLMLLSNIVLSFRCVISSMVNWFEITNVRPDLSLTAVHCYLD